MRRNLIWDNENKLYVPRLVYSFKGIFDFYITFLSILLVLIGAIIIALLTPNTYLLLFAMTLFYLSIQVGIKDYYERKGLKKIIRFGVK